MSLEQMSTRIDAKEPRAVTTSEPHLRSRLLDRYTLLRELGRGGMGTVYSAYDEELDRKIAIKLLRQATAGSLGAPKLLSEAQALARLSHPNVVQVYDVGVLSDQVFIAMEYVQGETLREWQRAAPRSWRECLAIYRQAGEGLSAAHEAGIVHRDVKPDNLMLGDDGRVRVMDFGLAQRGSAPPSGGLDPLSGDASAGCGALVGTPAYMPIEQLRGEPVGMAADTFALCVALWEAIFGVRPYAGATIPELREAVAAGVITPPPADRTAPRWLRDALTRGLAADPTQRWPSVRALLDALDRGLARAQQRRRLGLAAAALALVTITTAGADAWSSAERQRLVSSCKALGAELDPIWGDAAKAHLRAEIGASGLTFAASTVERVIPRLDAWSEQWKKVRVEACLSQQVVQSTPQDPHARAEACLDDQRVTFEVLIAELSTADADVVTSAVETTYKAPSPGLCASTTHLARRPTLPARDREQHRALRRAFARAAALLAAGRFEEGLELARSTRAAAESLAWPPALAASRLWVGIFQQRLGQNKPAMVELEAAYFTAARASAAELAAEAALELALAAGHGLALAEEGLRWSRHAELWLLEIADEGPTPRDVDLRSTRGLIHLLAGEYAESIADFSASIALGEAVLGPEHPSVAMNLSNLAIAQGQSGALEQARDSAARAAELIERALGPDHPEVTSSTSTLATRTIAHALAIEPEDPELAERELQRGIQLLDRVLLTRRRLHGDAHPDIAQTLHTLAQVRFLLGEVEGVEATFQEAIAMLERTAGPDARSLSYFESTLGLAQDAFGRHAQAQRTFERVLERQRRDHPEKTLEAATTLDRIGLALLHQGELAAARAHHEEAYQLRVQRGAELDKSQRALALLEARAGQLDRAKELLSRALPSSKPQELAEARFALAERLFASAPAEALELAELALRGLIAGGRRTAQRRGVVESWLQERRLL